MRHLTIPHLVGAVALALVAASCSSGSDAVTATIDSIAAADATTADAGTDASADSTGDAASVDVVFDAPTGDYTIVFPGEPVRNDLPVPLQGETVTADAYVFQNATSAYFTSAFDYPDGLTDPDPTVVLEGARDGAISNVGATLKDSEPVELAGIPGIAFTFEVSNGVQNGVGSAVIYFDTPRLYQSFALGETSGSADYQAFVDTFEFTGVGS